MRAIKFLLALLCSIVLVSCGGGGGGGTNTPAVTLQSISVTPTNPSIAKGTSEQFTATGTYSDNTSKNIASLVTWTSDTSSVATINASGLATSVNVGSSSITATLGGISGSTILTVIPLPIVSIVPSSITIVLPGNSPKNFIISNTGQQGSTLNYTVADDGALGGFLNVQDATGNILGGSSAVVSVSVLPQFVSTNPSLVGSTLILSVYTPNAVNYAKSLVDVYIINANIVIQSSNCTYLSTDNLGANQYSLQITGTASAAENDILTVSDAGYPGGVNTMACSGWEVGNNGTSCTRMPGEPVLTQWSYQENFSFSGATSGSALLMLENENISASTSFYCNFPGNP